MIVQTHAWSGADQSDQTFHLFEVRSQTEVVRQRFCCLAAGIPARSHISPLSAHLPLAFVKSATLQKTPTVSAYLFHCGLFERIKQHVFILHVHYERNICTHIPSPTDTTEFSNRGNAHVSHTNGLRDVNTFLTLLIRLWRVSRFWNTGICRNIQNSSKHPWPPQDWKIVYIDTKRKTMTVSAARRFIHIEEFL